ncbi:MAG: FecR family protein, partial [Cyclobacteriaceae bacterium]
INLRDQSRVFLNAESEIQHPENFGIDHRWVKLKGEAFFEITKNGRPFRVITSETEIKVLGTSFNVKEEEDELSVALVSGKVQVKDRNGNQFELRPTEMLILKDDGKMYKTVFDSLEIIGWKEKALVFNSNSIQEVRRKIEKWYAVEVRPKAVVSDDWIYSGVYHDESLENVLKGIFITSGMKFSVVSQPQLKHN